MYFPMSLLPHCPLAGCLQKLKKTLVLQITSWRQVIYRAAVKCWVQYVQIGTFLGSCVPISRQFPTQKFKGKQLVSHKISAKKLKHS